ncbi:Autophagy-related protein 18f [Apostasia shenzhenica]|uniref:Autophagy-related protein 18f n=1 Tax=Apostasia shenzhenica TaxID=1088818 RepID=A0A2I0AAP1_9ASPA|nr:Autophagy-related protein 18f [Apostasia shenzhenica]
MRNDVQKQQGVVSRNSKVNGFPSLRTCMRIVSSGASTVASTVRSAGASVASSIAERYEESIRDQVQWAGFDKVECEGNVLRQVLLLAYKHGFQIWDVEEADDVRQLASSHDGPVSFLQIQKKPISSLKSEDRFADIRPLLVIAGDISISCGGNNLVGCNLSPSNEIIEMGVDNLLPTVVRFYSISSREYVHVLKFRAAVYSVRCSSRVVAISQASQIHCFNSATLDKEYTILTHPIISGFPGSGSIAYGPLAVGPRWLAYSGAPIAVPDANRVSPQCLVPKTFSSSSTNGNLVVHYAKESSKQLAVGIMTVGDMGYKRLSKYCSELIPDVNGSIKGVNSSLKTTGIIKSHIPEMEDAGTVIVRDVVSKSIIVQFRAHKSLISALCFDPSGTLLVTASIHGHNINVFLILPSSELCERGTSLHLYRLQRGITNAVIQDISFSDDSQWIMISSSRGTSHLFSLSPSGGISKILSHNVKCPDGSYRPHMESPHRSSATELSHQYSFSGPVTLTVLSRIKNGNNGWKGAVSAAAAATGKVNPISGAIASAFHNCKNSGAYIEANSFGTKYYFLLFSSSGGIIQYVLHQYSGEDSGMDLAGISAASHGLSLESDSRFVVQPLQKWDVCHKRNRRDKSDTDAYNEHGNVENTKLFQKAVKKVNSIHPTNSGLGPQVKRSSDGSHHSYISEVELQMHSDPMPLWSWPRISFQAMVDNTTELDNKNALDGEIEIEKISYRTIAVRSENLKPVLSHRQLSNTNHLRTSDASTSTHGLLMNLKSQSAEAGLLSRRSSCSSFDPIPDSPAPSESYNGSDDRYFGVFEEGFVNNTSESPHIADELGHVNISDGL